ncbi:putative acyl carrier protein [Clavispora lusitaniae]|uniref:Acyl carrier protein n=1 Tax=Clavispora lusitaniae TaxID=36911 RepID=A0ACD0WMG1_CLALS|nr:putative acyl carrier protein [Clavispora lusitaniae]QFZ34249.1 putative acyl carrier protein [Clavispora lusitaniae]QFZ39933.1 putative acyl carrier protein [Clavispora lusitaniae]QFZ45615.1 putative acyl carrier protein [Clavispora lusitaniae]QFZ51279.1 putative acyl carrier protein [Clavispora lusitaniae]
MPLLFSTRKEQERSQLSIWETY